MAKLTKRANNYSEADLIKLFDLTRIKGSERFQPLQFWLNIPPFELTETENNIFESIWQDALNNIEAWQEEDLKMQFIAFVLRLGDLRNDRHFHPYFERTVSATVKGHFLKTKTDFMYAKGILNQPEIPYFHFQEWKPQKNPTGDSMAQLIEAMLIAQEVNGYKKPIYGCEVVGRSWVFVVLEGTTYASSKVYDCTEREDLKQIIGILRHFKSILTTLS